MVAAGEGERTVAASPPLRLGLCSEEGLAGPCPVTQDPQNTSTYFDLVPDMLISLHLVSSAASALRRSDLDLPTLLNSHNAARFRSKGAKMGG